MNNELNITKGGKGWYVVDNFSTEDRHDFQIACNVDRGSRHIAQVIKRNYSLENDLPTLKESKDNAEAIVTAITETYGKGYNPAAFDEMYKALQYIADWDSFKDHPIGRKAATALKNAKLLKS